MLLLLIFGSIEMARLMAIYSALSSASRQAARYGSVNGDRDPSTGGIQQYALDCTGIRSTAKRTAFLQGLSDSDITITYDHGSGSSFANCVQDVDPGLTNGDRIVIRVSTTYRPIVPIVPIPSLPVTFVAARTFFSSMLGPTPTYLCTLGVVSSGGHTDTSSVRQEYNSIGTNGGNTDKITVTLRDSHSCLVQGIKVTLAQYSGPGTSTITSADSSCTPGPCGITDSNGEAVFYATTCTIGTYKYQGTDLGDSPNVTISEKATVYWVYGDVDGTQSTLTASPGYPPGVEANGSSQATLTATLRDACGNAVGTSKSVQLSQVSGPTTLIVTTNPTSTDASGVATWGVTSALTGVATYGITDVSDSLALSATASQTFVPGPVKASNSSMTAATPIMAGTPITVTATVKDPYGFFNTGNVIDNRTFNLAVYSGPASVGSVVATGTSDASGNLTLYPTLTIAGDYVLALYDTANPSSEVLYATTHIYHSSAYSANSSLAASQYTVLADGSDYALVLATLKDQYTNGVAACVSLTATPASGATIASNTGPDPSCTNPALPYHTDASGVAVFNVTSTTLGSVSLLAETDSDLQFLGPITISFVTPGPQSVMSTVTRSTSKVYADGSSTATITVHVVDGKGNPLKNVTVNLASSRGVLDTITGIGSPMTDVSGNIQFTVSSSTVGSSTFTATATDMTPTPPGVTFPVVFAQTVSIAFTEGPADPTASTIVAVPTTVSANNLDTSTVTVTLIDAQGRLIPNRTVTLNKVSGPGTISGSPATTNASGQAVFTIKSNSGGDAVLSATATPENVTLSGTATVSFLDNFTYASKSTINLSPAIMESNGTSAGTVTITLKDFYGNPAVGKTVTLTSSRTVSDTITVVGSNQSGPTGVVKFTVKSLYHGTATLTATAFDSGGAECNPSCTLPTVSPYFTTNKTTSTISRSPTIVASDNNMTSTVTVTLLDGASQPVTGHTVTLAAVAPDTPTITTVSGTTNASGQATFTTRYGSNKTVSYTATDTTDSVTLTSTGSVQFACVTGAAGTWTATGSDGFVTYTFTNPVGSSMTLSGMTLNWPDTGAGQNKLYDAYFTSDLTNYLWSARPSGQNPTTFTWTSATWNGTGSRVVPASSSRTLRFEFSRQDTGSYILSALTFTTTGSNFCTMTSPASSLTVTH